MKTPILWRAASIVTVALALAAQGEAQTAARTKLGGNVDDYTAVSDPAGPWHISGQWAVSLEGDSGRGAFSVALSMVRSQNASPAAHTHHVTLSHGDVTPLANGFRISGNAVIASNGSLAGFSGSPVEIQVTGGNALASSNMTVTFGGAAAVHFGDLPLHGVVTLERR